MSQEPTIVRKGSWPLFKYTVRVFGFHTIFIDDEEGNLMISSDRGAFRHWWGRSGRGKEFLREFLVTANDGYISDKLSYGLSRWDGEEARNQIYRACTDKWGHIESWPKEVAEMVEAIDEDWSSDMLYSHLMDCEEFCEVWPPGDFPVSERYANKDVDIFMKKVWPSLQSHWKQELETEKAERNAETGN